MTVKQYADYWDVSATIVARYINQGRIKIVKNKYPYEILPNQPYPAQRKRGPHSEFVTKHYRADRGELGVVGRYGSYFPPKGKNDHRNRK